MIIKLKRLSRDDLDKKKKENPGLVGTPIYFAVIDDTRIEIWPTPAKKWPQFLIYYEMPKGVHVNMSFDPVQTSPRHRKYHGACKKIWNRIRGIKEGK